MDETERLADRLVIFDCGELLVFDTPAEAAAAMPSVHDEALVDAGAALIACRRRTWRRHPGCRPKAI